MNPTVARTLPLAGFVSEISHSSHVFELTPRLLFDRKNRGVEQVYIYKNVRYVAA